MHKKTIAILTLLIISTIGPIIAPAKSEISTQDNIRVRARLADVLGRWEFQAWWSINMTVINIANDGNVYGEYYLYCLNLDEAMEGRLAPGRGSLEKNFQNPSGGTWKFNVNLSGNYSELYAIVVDF